ncbi:hypothetical protein [Burkholderia gladioli]|uniref:hypothetical protein n=1 Tax=Burkholderia gladioli TaxID=28095 RepID=UPI00163E5999|nr:hypothetical protein [Burkholderia gladioli]
MFSLFVIDSPDLQRVKQKEIKSGGRLSIGKRQWNQARRAQPAEATPFVPGRREAGVVVLLLQIDRRRNGNSEVLIYSMACRVGRSCFSGAIRPLVFSIDRYIAFFVNGDAACADARARFTHGRNRCAGVDRQARRAVAPRFRLFSLPLM